MKFRHLVMAAALTALTGLVGAHTPVSGIGVAKAAEPIQLPDRNWDKFNKSELDKLLATYGKTSPNYNPKKRPYAVVDWDNSMVFLDTEEAALIYQLENLRFKMTPAQMDKALRKDIPEKDFVADYKNAAGQLNNINTVVPDAVESYTWLYNNYKGLKGNLPLAEVKKSPHYMNFITKVRYLYDAIGDTFDVAVSYPWVLYLFTGMTEKDVRQLTVETMDWQMMQPVQKVKWTSPESLPGKAGVVSVSWKNGFRAFPEMQDLAAAMEKSGIDVWICTASFVDVIKEASINKKLGYVLPAGRVIGMELERNAKGVIQTEFRRGYDQTQGKGKTKAIERFLVSKYGYGPLFVSGDSEGDQNMMQDFADTRLVLIINRLKGKDIDKLSRIAVDSYGKPGAKVILQGRDDNTGLFVPSQMHIKLGASQGQVLRN